MKINKKKGHIMQAIKISLNTIIGADDASQLNFFTQFNSGAWSDALRKEYRTGQATKQSNFAKKLLTSSCERDW